MKIETVRYTPCGTRRRLGAMVDHSADGVYGISLGIRDVIGVLVIVDFGSTALRRNRAAMRRGWLRQHLPG